MGILTVRLFGKMQIRRGDRVLGDLGSRKAQELFAYLLIHRQRLHCREALASLLWGNSTTAQSLKYLRQALWQLQILTDAAPDEAKADQLLLVDPEWVGLNPQGNLWLDVAVFEQAFAQAQNIRGAALSIEGAQALRNAVQLYKGDLLEDCYEDWCLFERERLQNMYLAMLDKLAGYCEAHNEYETGLVYGTHILRYDRARERTHRRLMRLHYLAGNRTAALRQYESCVAALDEELGVEPARRTVELYKQIRADQFDSMIAETYLPSGVTTAPLPNVLGHLKQLCTTLTSLRQQVEQEIQAIEQTLS
jgi:DNA-binding SARP family transcriptional activator